MKAFINMKRLRIHLFVFLVLIFVFLNCTKKMTPIDYEYNFGNGNITSVRLLFTGDSLEIDYDYKGTNETDAEFKWLTSIGTIRGSGRHVTYYAPSEEGWITIKVIIFDGISMISDSVDILIYKQIIILKADDLEDNSSGIIPIRWEKFISYCQANDIKANMGLIGNSLNNANPSFVSYLKSIMQCELFEIWNHGYDHIVGQTNSYGETYSEFQNTSYEYQKNQLLKTQNLAKKMLGIKLRAFGAPGNKIDENTSKALDEIDEIKIWFFGLENSKKLILKHFLDIEFPTHHPVFEKFLEKYDSKIKCIVFQIHPNSWGEQDFEEFTKIIDYLTEQEVTFLKVYEYYIMLNYNNIGR